MVREWEWRNDGKQDWEGSLRRVLYVFIWSLDLLAKRANGFNIARRVIDSFVSVTRLPTTATPPTTTTTLFVHEVIVSVLTNDSWYYSYWRRGCLRALFENSIQRKREFTNCFVGDEGNAVTLLWSNNNNTSLLEHGCISYTKWYQPV